MRETGVVWAIRVFACAVPRLNGQLACEWKRVVIVVTTSVTEDAGTQANRQCQRQNNSTDAQKTF